MVRVACVLMQKNERERLGPWLRYHGYLFGLSNLYVIDHASSDINVIETLTAYKKVGVKIFTLDASADYRLKGEYVSDLLETLDKEGNHDILMPLDCDEFVVTRIEDGRFTCEKSLILADLYHHVTSGNNAKITSGLLNIPGKEFQYLLCEHTKVFFIKGHCGRVDHGSHTEITGRVACEAQTNLAHLHFHHRSVENLVKTAREKLAPFVDVNNEECLIKFKGSGHHLIRYLSNEVFTYLNLLNGVTNLIEVQGLSRIFQQLGIDIAMLSR